MNYLVHSHSPMRKNNYIEQVEGLGTTKNVSRNPSSTALVLFPRAKLCQQARFEADIPKGGCTAISGRGLRLESQLCILGIFQFKVTDEVPSVSIPRDVEGIGFLQSGDSHIHRTIHGERVAVIRDAFGNDGNDGWESLRG